MYIVQFSRSCECTYLDVVFDVRAVRCYNLFIDILFSCMFILFIYYHNICVFLESPNISQSDDESAPVCVCASTVRRLYANK